MTENWRPGAILYSVVLTNHLGEIADIKNIVAEFNVYEDMFSSTLKADLLIVDTQGLPEAFPIVGDETFTIEFQTDPSAEKVNLTFRSYKLSKRTISKEREHMYVLHGASPELFANLFTEVEEAYIGLKAHEVASAVHGTYIPGKAIEAEPTINKLTFTSAGQHPIEFINMVATEAQSEEFPDSSYYLFYEDHIGFKFKSIAKLLSEGPVETYYFADPAGDKDLARDKGGIKQYQIIAALSFDETFDILKGVIGGMIDTQVAYIDPLMKKYEVFKFKYIDDFDKLDNFEGPGGGQRILPQPGFYAGKPGIAHTRMVAADWNDDEETPNSQTFGDRISEATDPHRFHSSKRWKWYHNGIALLQSLHQYSINITVPGNSNAKCGDVIDIFIPQNSPLVTDDATKYLKLFGQENSKFLVTAVLHNYKQTTGDYYTTIQGVKQSMDKEPVPTA